MKGKYKRKQVWCDTCDAEIVELGTKCRNCGIRQHGVKLKKPNNYEIIVDWKQLEDCGLDNKLIKW